MMTPWGGDRWVARGGGWWIGVIAAWLVMVGSWAPTVAQELPPAEVTINGVELVLIPEGWFYKSGGVYDASSDDPENGGVARIWLDSYYIAKYEARASDLLRFFRSPAGRPLAEKYKNGASEGCALRKDGSGELYLTNGEEGNLPATHVSWEIADSWARWMGLRLPTEAEWEKAARGTDQRTFPWGDEYPDETFAAFRGGFACNPRPVDSYLKGVSPYGIYNMAGNVRELVADWYNGETDAALRDGVRNPPLAERSTRHPLEGEGMKMVKGGRWAIGAPGLRIMRRVHIKPDFDFVCNGTRFAADVATVTRAIEMQR